MWVKTRIEAERARQFLKEHRNGHKKGRIVIGIGRQQGVIIYLYQSGAVRFEIPPRSPGLQTMVEAWLSNIGRRVAVGEVFQGIVTSVKTFGAFVMIMPDQEALLHISRYRGGLVPLANDLVSVMVEEIDLNGHVNLTM